MKVIITGGSGVIGCMLARRLLDLGQLTGPGGAPEAIDEIVLFDLAPPDVALDDLEGRVTVSAGDISDRDTGLRPGRPRRRLGVPSRLGGQRRRGA